MLIDICCQKKYVDVFLIKLLCILSKNSIRNYNTLCDIHFGIHTPPWNQSCDKWLLKHQTMHLPIGRDHSFYQYIINDI